MLEKILSSKNRVQPSSYDSVLFHSIRSAQLASSAIVCGILSFFVQQLLHDKQYIPWTFILLLVVSVLTIAALSMTTVVHCFIGLNARLNMIVNSGLVLIWAVGFALLTWWSSGTLTHSCSKRIWKISAAVNICRCYKVLFTFSLLGFVSTALALYLDFNTYRSMTRRGHYDRPQTDAIRNSTDGSGKPLHGNEELELNNSGGEDREGLLGR